MWRVVLTIYENGHEGINPLNSIRSRHMIGE